MENEIWKDIPGFEGLYQASTFGNIKSLDRIIVGRWGKQNRKGVNPMKQQTDYLGYKFLHLCGKLFKVHRLIALTFIPNPNNKPQVNHKNGLKWDNRVDNLEWNTSSENCIHAFKINLKNQDGEKHPSHKLTNDKILKIRELYLTGNYTLKELSNKYDVSFQHISDIVNRKTWKHI